MHVTVSFSSSCHFHQSIQQGQAQINHPAKVWFVDMCASSIEVQHMYLNQAIYWEIDSREGSNDYMALSEYHVPEL